MYKIKDVKPGEEVTKMKQYIFIEAIIKNFALIYKKKIKKLRRNRRPVFYCKGLPSDNFTKDLMNFYAMIKLLSSSEKNNDEVVMVVSLLFIRSDAMHLSGFFDNIKLDTGLFLRKGKWPELPGDYHIPDKYRYQINKVISGNEFSGFDDYAENIVKIFNKKADKDTDISSLKINYNEVISETVAEKLTLFQNSTELLSQAMAGNDDLTVQTALSQLKTHAMNLRNFFDEIVYDTETVICFDGWPEIGENYRIPDKYDCPDERR